MAETTPGLWIFRSRQQSSGKENRCYDKVCQDTCCIWCGVRDGYGFNEGEMCFILSWFGVHQSILRSWGDISVLLVLWQCCWGLSRVQSSKSRLLICLIGKTQLLCMQCRGIRPHLVARGKSHVFSRVAAGTWVIFSSYERNAHSKREFAQWSQDTCLDMTDTSWS